MGSLIMTLFTFNFSLFTCYAILSFMKTVIIIDDHELMRTGLITLLRNNWQIAGSAATLEEARAIFKSLDNPPDLVLIGPGIRKRMGA